MTDPDLKLFTVTVSTEVVVAAESLEAAQVYAEGNLIELVLSDGEAFEAEADPFERLPDGWDADSLVYGVTDDRPVGSFPCYAEHSKSLSRAIDFMFEPAPKPQGSPLDWGGKESSE